MVRLRGIRISRTTQAFVHQILRGNSILSEIESRVGKVRAKASYPSYVNRGTHFISTLLYGVRCHAENWRTCSFCYRVQKACECLARKSKKSPPSEALLTLPRLL